MAFYNDINNPYNIISSFSHNPINDFGIYAKDYRKAANHLVENFLSQGSHGDHEGYPIVFLYRHVLELHLKNIIYQGARLAKLKNISKISKIRESLYPIHKLTTLSKEAIGIINILFQDIDLKVFMEKVKKITEEFEEIDPMSYSYRYPINNNGDYSTKKNQIVNIESIYNNLYEIFNSLEAIDFGIDIEIYKANDIRNLLNKLSNN